MIQVKQKIVIDIPKLIGIILIETQKGENKMTMFKFKDGKLTINIQEIADKATEGAIIAKQKATEGAVIAKKKATEALQYTNEKLKERAVDLDDKRYFASQEKVERLERALEKAKLELAQEIEDETGFDNYLKSLYAEAPDEEVDPDPFQGNSFCEDCAAKGTDEVVSEVDKFINKLTAEHWKSEVKKAEAAAQKLVEVTSVIDPLDERVNIRVTVTEGYVLTPGIIIEAVRKYLEDEINALTSLVSLFNGGTFSLNCGTLSLNGKRENYTPEVISALVDLLETHLNVDPKLTLNED